jgi:hypothetical protein
MHLVWIADLVDVLIPGSWGRSNDPAEKWRRVESDAIVFPVAPTFVAQNHAGRVLGTRGTLQMVLDFESSAEQLFDLQADPGNSGRFQRGTGNRAQTAAERRGSIRRFLRSRMKTTAWLRSATFVRMDEPCYPGICPVTAVLRERGLCSWP